MQFSDRSGVSEDFQMQYFRQTAIIQLIYKVKAARGDYGNEGG
jgi:hypothetical protein